jgi:hypothetical protein
MTKAEYAVAPGSEDSPCPLVQRQWSIQIGNILNYCEVDSLATILMGQTYLPSTRSWLQ